MSARLDVAIAELGFARSRSQAAELIAAGRVRVDGEIAFKASMRVADGAEVVVDSDHYVSRAAHKLLAGLDAAGIDPVGRLALDLGASTGGFTQVLLERGAREVIALDVGHGQLAEQIRHDTRVRVVEGCNARELDPEKLREVSGATESPTLVVGDLSFISLRLVLPAIASVMPPGAEAVLLIKPQFEVGRQGVRGGIVTDPLRAQEAVDGVVDCAAELGLSCRGLTPSPLPGEHGNQEFLAYFFKEVTGA